MNKIISTLLLVIIILVGAKYLYTTYSTKNTTDVIPATTLIEDTTPNSTSTTPNTAATSSVQNSNTSTSPNAKTYTITYKDTGFSPTPITINVGDTVTFKNESSRSFWPASDEHPTHTAYPEFDPKKSIPAGSSRSFTFTKKGAWKYHDHRASNFVGLINVQ